MNKERNNINCTLEHTTINNAKWKTNKQTKPNQKWNRNSSTANDFSLASHDFKSIAWAQVKRRLNAIGTHLSTRIKINKQHTNRMPTSRPNGIDMASALCKILCVCARVGFYLFIYLFFFELEFEDNSKRFLARLVATFLVESEWFFSYW